MIATHFRTEARDLPDDREGDRHQRFLLRTSGGIAVLMAHNIDPAQRLEPPEVGDSVHFAGKYVWNARGGVVPRGVTVH